MNRAERAVILPITIGSILEWYEIYLYFYWIPYIDLLYGASQAFFETINIVFIVLVGFIARPLGGLVFGYIGDRWGRRKAFLLSILFISIPSFLTAFMPTFDSWAWFVLIYINVMRFFQGMPAGGELAGSLCFLYETATPDRRRYLCSYMLIGPQIGQILAMIQCYILAELLPRSTIATWGWRLSFLIGGIIGIAGFCLRKKLQETKRFHLLQTHHQIASNPVRESFKNHKSAMFLGFLISIFEVASFFLITFYLVENSKDTLNLNTQASLAVYSILLTPVIFIMPLIGKLGDMYNNKRMFFWSTILIILLSLPFYLAILHSHKGLSIFLLILLIVAFCVQFALLPSLLANLFPTKVRFTCVGLSFNVCDSIFGGFIPLIAIGLIHFTGNFASFVAILPITAVLFLCTMPFVKWEERAAER